MKLLLMLCVLICLAAVWVGVPPPLSEWSAKLEAPRMALELECGPASADMTRTVDCIAGSGRQTVPLQTQSAQESGSPQPDWEQLGSLLAQGREYEAARLESEWLSREATAQAALSRLCSHPPLEDLEELRDIVWRKYQRKRLPWDDVASLDRMLEERRPAHPEPADPETE